MRVGVLQRIAFCLVLCGLGTVAALAQNYPLPVKVDTPMQFAVVRSNAPGCEPTCPEWISAEGKIVSGSPGRLSALFKRIGGRRLPVVLHSPGGDVDAAIALGRFIRKNKIDTMVGRTLFAHCAPPETGCHVNDRKRIYQGVTLAIGADCSSACPFVLAGGRRRVANCVACVGIHEIVMERTVTRKKKGRKTTTRDVKPITKSYRRKIEKYFSEMGTGSWIVSAMQDTPNDKIRYLRADELTFVNLVPVQDWVDGLTANVVCATNPVADNCRTVGKPKQ